MTAHPNLDELVATMRAAAEAARDDRDRVRSGDARGEKLWALPDVVSAFAWHCDPANVLTLLDALAAARAETAALRARAEIDADA